jgi:hypothetical protein
MITYLFITKVHSGVLKEVDNLFCYPLAADVYINERAVKIRVSVGANWWWLWPVGLLVTIVMNPALLFLAPPPPALNARNHLHLRHCTVSMPTANTGVSRTPPYQLIGPSFESFDSAVLGGGLRTIVIAVGREVWRFVEALCRHSASA